MISANINIKNVSQSAIDKKIKYIVARPAGGSLWFYGAYRSKQKAYDIALALDCACVIEAKWGEDDANEN